jgi:hypothetical protein
LLKKVERLSTLAEIPAKLRSELFDPKYFESAGSAADVTATSATIIANVLFVMLNSSRNRPW